MKTTIQSEQPASPAQEPPSAQVVSLRELGGSQPSGNRLLEGNLSIISGVKVRVEVVVGSAEMSVAELFAIQRGSTVALEELHDAPLAVRLDGRTIARGHLVVVGDNFGIRIVDILATTDAQAK